MGPMGAQQPMQGATSLNPETLEPYTLNQKVTEALMTSGYSVRDLQSFRFRV